MKFILSILSFALAIPCFGFGERVAVQKNDCNDCQAIETGLDES